MGGAIRCVGQVAPVIHSRFNDPLRLSHASSKFFLSRQITHLPAYLSFPHHPPALSFKQEPVSFPLTAGHYAAPTRVSGACQSFTNGRLSRRTHPTVPAICRGYPTGRSALHFN